MKWMNSTADLNKLQDDTMRHYTIEQFLNFYSILEQDEEYNIPQPQLGDKLNHYITITNYIILI